MLALERERGALGIVLVITASRTRLDDPRELSPEPAQPLEDACPLRRQQLSYASLRQTIRAGYVTVRRMAWTSATSMIHAA